MLYPSIDLLMTKLDSKYTLVTVAAKRARQLQVKNDLTIEKPVSKNVVQAKRRSFLALLTVLFQRSRTQVTLQLVQ